MYISKLNADKANHVKMTKIVEPVAEPILHCAHTFMHPAVLGAFPIRKGPFPIKRAQVLEAGGSNESEGDLAQGILKKVANVLEQNNVEAQNQLSVLSSSIKERIEEMKKKLSSLDSGKDSIELHKDGFKGTTSTDRDHSNLSVVQEESRSNAETAMSSSFEAIVDDAVEN